MEASAVHMEANASFADVYYELDRYKPVFAEWKRLGKACKLPIAEVKAIRADFDIARADEKFTEDEVLPLFARMEELIVKTNGSPLVVPTKEPVPTTAFGCPVAQPPPLMLEVQMPMIQAEIRGLPPHLMQARTDVDEASGTADANLQLLGQAQVAYYGRNKKYLSFAKGDARTWKALGVTLPKPARHVYSASANANGFRILAQANFDKDPFVDRWLLDHKTASPDRCPTPTLLASDALNLSFEGSEPAIIADGKPQPLRKFP